MKVIRCRVKSINFAKDGFTMTASDGTTYFSIQANDNQFPNGFWEEARKFISNLAEERLVKLEIEGDRITIMPDYSSGGVFEEVFEEDEYV